MRVHVLDKWVEYMESGKYNFCRGRLRRVFDDPLRVCNCATGVLCEVAIELGVMKREGDMYWHIAEPTILKCITPPFVLSKYIAEERPFEPIHELIDAVITANDDDDSYKNSIALVKKFLSQEPESKYYAPGL